MAILNGRVHCIHPSPHCYYPVRAEWWLQPIPPTITTRTTLACSSLISTLIKPVSHEPQCSLYRRQKRTTSALHVSWIADTISHCTRFIPPHLVFTSNSNTPSIPLKKVVLTWVAYWVQCSSGWRGVFLFCSRRTVLWQNWLHPILSSRLLSSQFYIHYIWSYSN